MFFGIEKNSVNLPLRINYGDPSIDTESVDVVRNLLPKYGLMPTQTVPQYAVSIKLEPVVLAARAMYDCKTDDQIDACASFRIALLGHLSHEFQRLVSRPEYVEYASGNPYAEKDVAHFVDVANLAGELWRKKYETFRPDALTVAALWHDIDRALPDNASSDPMIRTERRIVDTRNVPDNEYGNRIKTTKHPENCAAIYRELNRGLQGFCNLELFHDDVARLIASHEIGQRGVRDLVLDRFEDRWYMRAMADVLCEADGMSFFHVLLPEYAKGRPPERVAAKVRFSLEKLSPEGREMVLGFDYSDPELRELVESAARLH